MITTDTHAHLQWKSFDKDRDAVILRARQATVSIIVNIGYDINGSRAAVELADEYPGLYASVGIHPHDAVHVTASALDELNKLAQNKKVVAIGEIGLDFYRDLSPRSSQKEAFQKQLDLAANLNMPVVIHLRDAYDQAYEILSNSSSELRGVIHCWSSNMEMALKYLELGFYISIAGPVTYANARELASVAEQVPLDRILVETDCPWLSPQSHRGLRNEPGFICETVQTIARIRGVTAELIGEQTTNNACRLFCFQS